MEKKKNEDWKTRDLGFSLVGFQKFRYENTCISKDGDFDPCRRRSGHRMKWNLTLSHRQKASRLPKTPSQRLAMLQPRLL